MLLNKIRKNKVLSLVIFVLAIYVVVAPLLWWCFIYDGLRLSMYHADKLELYGQAGDFLGGILNPLMAFFTTLVLVMQWKMTSDREAKSDEMRDLIFRKELFDVRLRDIQKSLEEISFDGEQGLKAFEKFNTYDFSFGRHDRFSATRPLVAEAQPGFDLFYKRAKSLCRMVNQIYSNVLIDSRATLESGGIESELFVYKFDRLKNVLPEELIFYLEKLVCYSLEENPELEFDYDSSFLFCFSHLKPMGAAIFPSYDNLEIFEILDEYSAKTRRYRSEDHLTYFE